MEVDTSATIKKLRCTVNSIYIEFEDTNINKIKCSSNEQTYWKNIEHSVNEENKSNDIKMEDNNNNNNNKPKDEKSISFHFLEPNCEYKLEFYS